MVLHKIKKAIVGRLRQKKAETKNPFSDVHKEITIDTRYPIERIHHPPIKVSGLITLEPSVTREVKLVKVNHKSKPKKAYLSLSRLRKPKKPKRKR